MDVLKYMLYGVLILVVMVIIISILYVFINYMRYGNKYTEILKSEEWLKVIHYPEWKTPQEIRDDMKKLKGVNPADKNFARSTVYIHLAELEEQELIESEKYFRENSIRNIPMYRYRLTRSGGKKKTEQKETDEEMRGNFQSI